MLLQKLENSFKDIKSIKKSGKCLPDFKILIYFINN